MKRGRDEMFPRIHVNDGEKGWARGPPRNKMALYEQLTIPSLRFQPFAGGLQGEADGRGVFFSYQLPIRHQPEEISSQHSDLTAPLTQLNLRKKPDEDEFRVPISSHSIQIQESAEYANEIEQGKVSPSDPSCVNPLSRFRKRRVVIQEGKSQTSDLSSIEKQADSSIRTLATLETDRRSSYDRGSFRSRDLERADSVSEVSAVESVAGQETTPNDVVGMIGQKHFWKARKAILKQQRVFALQLFELHRLVEVQKLFAESLVVNSAFIDKPKVLPTPAEETPNVRKQICEPQTKASSAAKATGKASSSSTQNGVVSSSCRPLTGHSPIASNGGPWGHQWLIPVMTPSEGLVYKPYPGPGFVGPPGYYQPPSFPPAGPHGYFPMQMSVQSQNLPWPRSHKSRAFRDGSNSLHDDEVVEASRGSSPGPVEIIRGSNDTKRANVLSLFPLAPSPGNPRFSPARSEPDIPMQVIEVVPHNARSATESAARVFRSIQEERKQY